jgi:hypothetical protein
MGVCWLSARSCSLLRSSFRKTDIVSTEKSGSAYQTTRS